MPFNFQNRRRKKTLREQVLRNKKLELNLGGLSSDEAEEEEETRSTVSASSSNRKVSKTKDSPDSFLTSTPMSLKGSFLKNKLENPLFKNLFKRTASSSNLSKVFTKKDGESDYEEDNFSTDSETEESSNIQLNEDFEEEEERERKWSLLRLAKPKSRTRSLRGRSKRTELSPSIATLTGTSSRRLGSRSFGGLFNKRKGKGKKIDLRLSNDSSSSNSSSLTGSSISENEQELDVELLTKLEDDEVAMNENSSNNANNCATDTNTNSNTSYLLYTHKGEAVRVKFFLDYLLISPVIHKLSLTRAKTRARLRAKIKEQSRFVYYEDLALWTNNDDCLRLVHIKNKHTALQERSEIKLFTNKKKQLVTARELNEELKDRVSVLMAGRMNISATEAREMLEQNNTERDVDRVVQEIDRNGEKCLAQSYTQDLVADDSATHECYELLNV